MSLALEARGLWVERPFERSSVGGGYVSHYDLDLTWVRDRVEWEASCKYLSYGHFALVCSPWGSSNTLNGGTRRIFCPEGGLSPWSGRSGETSRLSMCVVFVCCFMLLGPSSPWKIMLRVSFGNLSGGWPCVKRCVFRILALISALTPCGLQAARITNILRKTS